MFGLGVTIRGPRVYVLIGKHAHVPVVVSEEGGGARCPGLVVDEAIRNFGSLF